MTKVVTVSERGALTLPKRIREVLGVTCGGQIVVDLDPAGGVRLRSGVVVPVEMYSPGRERDFQKLNEVPLASRKLAWRKGG
jgi:AbrB family looped-hinge helix DNA binding protein